jgi:hypothetical protein
MPPTSPEAEITNKHSKVNIRAHTNVVEKNIRYIFSTCLRVFMVIKKKEVNALELLHCAYTSKLVHSAINDGFQDTCEDYQAYDC